MINLQPDSLKVTKSLIDCYREEVVNKAECWLGKDLPYAKEVIVEEFDIRFKAHIYYSVEKVATEQALLFEKIVEYEKALSLMTEIPKTSYAKYFKISKKEKKLEFARDIEKINQEISRLGFFVIAETDFRATSKGILEAYRKRDMIEKAFDEIKNELN